VNAEALARELGIEGRSLRRAISAGTTGRRTSKRGLAVDEDEQAYLRTHWELLARLRSGLRTEPNVRVAVLFGSAARGDDRASSDIDLAISFKRDTTNREIREMQARLGRKVDRRVESFRLEGMRDDAPVLAPVLAQGRPIVDRGGLWPSLLGERRNVVRRAKRSSERRWRYIRERLSEQPLLR